MGEEAGRSSRDRKQGGEANSEAARAERVRVEYATGTVAGTAVEASEVTAETETAKSGQARPRSSVRPARNFCTFIACLVP